METAATELPNWQRVVSLVQVAYGEGNLVEEATWQAPVLIPKEGG